MHPFDLLVFIHTDIVGFTWSEQARPWKPQNAVGKQRQEVSSWAFWEGMSNVWLFTFLYIEILYKKQKQKPIISDAQKTSPFTNSHDKYITDNKKTNKPLNIPL